MLIGRRLDPERLGLHLDRLYRAAWGLCGSREAAEDLVQDTCARVLARPRLLRGEDDLGYLLRVLRNTWISQRRAAARRPVTVPVPDDESALADRGALAPDEALETRAVYAAIAELAPSFRDALVAVDVVGLTYAEAGRALDAPEGTIATRVFRARRQVAASLRPSDRAGP